MLTIKTSVVTLKPGTLWSSPLDHRGDPRPMINIQGVLGLIPMSANKIEINKKSRIYVSIITTNYPKADESQIPNRCLQ
jgi:hypothetical protein